MNFDTVNNTMASRWHSPQNIEDMNGTALWCISKKEDESVQAGEAATTLSYQFIRYTSDGMLLSTFTQELYLSSILSY